ncbi:MAG: hypothetical protein KGJ06_02265 [Pseudomonadota bacterium]|nr:hypothetical protein [Pseudomonadota bacterium]
MAVFFFQSAAHAQDDSAEVAALKTEVKALEARIDQLEKRQQASAPISGNVEKRLAVVERKQEVQQEQQQAQAASVPSVEVGPNGLSVISYDRQYSATLRGYVQADNRTFLNGGAKTGTTDTFLIRSARPIIDARMTDYFDMHFMMDFGKGQTTLLDAYGNFHPLPGNNLLNLRIGETKVPVGLERWQPEQDVLFVERGQTTNLVPYRDIGAMLYGQMIPDQLEYYLGIMNGAADLQANTGDGDQDKDIVGRIFTHPLLWSGVHALEGLGVGVAGTYGNHQGSVTAPGLTSGYVTPGQRVWFAYSAGTFADGPEWRLNPQLTYYNNAFGMFAEYVANDQEVGHGAATAKLRNNAWEGVTSYVLTGEDAAFDGVKPAHNFDPKAGYWGAFELVGRMSELSVDKKAFPAFASLTASSSRAFERTLGATWYFNQAVKFNLDFSLTSFDGGAAARLDHADEKAVMSRMQMKF